MRDNDLWIRLALGAPCVGLAVWFMYDSTFNPWIGMFGVIPCLMAFALIVFPSVTAEAGRLVSNIIIPHRDAAPRPNTSRPDALRFHGDPVQALAEYRRVLADFPHDLQIWNTCFEIAWIDLGDREIAAEWHRRALRANDDPEARARLTHHYLTHARRHPDYEVWAEEEEALALRRLRVAQVARG